MSLKEYILAIDQGTSSTKTLAFDRSGRVEARGSARLDISYEGNFVEQDPEVIYTSVLESVRACMSDLGRQGVKPDQIVSVGLTNQRETFVLWDGRGKVFCNAVSWQCKRSTAVCDRLKKEGKEVVVKEKTGLPIDPYFSATKLIWLVENNPVIASELAQGNVFFGTVDTWLLYRLTEGACYMTDHTNASRTMLYNIYDLQWDAVLLEQFGLSGLNLPEVKPSGYTYAYSDFDGLFAKPVAIEAVVGDSQAAALGAGCFRRGEAKATLGTGSSIMMAVGEGLVYKGQNTVDAIYYSTEKGVVYAAEGIIVSCGSTLTWMKEQLALFEDVGELESIANAAPSNHGITFIPAFSGMGTPYWKNDAKAAIVGLTFGSDRAHVVRAALESVCFQVKDVIVATENEHRLSLSQLVVNGGMSANRFVVQLLADILEKPVVCSAMPDASALGCARLVASGVWSTALHESLPQKEGGEKVYLPDTNNKWGQLSYAKWLESVSRYL